MAPVLSTGKNLDVFRELGYGKSNWQVTQRKLTAVRWWG